MPRGLTRDARGAGEVHLRIEFSQALGKLHTTLLSASQLADSNWFDTLDPYCVVGLARSESPSEGRRNAARFRTRAKPGSQSRPWQCASRTFSAAQVSGVLARCPDMTLCGVSLTPLPRAVLLASCLRLCPQARTRTRARSRTGTRPSHSTCCRPVRGLAPGLLWTALLRTLAVGHPRATQHGMASVA